MPYQHVSVPANDGGLCLGQLAIAAARDASETRSSLMCLGIPGRAGRDLREHDVLMGKVDFGGVTKRVCLEHVPDVQPGDYVLVHVGFALTRLDEAEAGRVFEFLEADEPARRAERDLTVKYLDEYRDGGRRTGARRRHRARR